MSKNKTGLDFSKVTPALIKQVEAVLAEADKHRYSASAVYAAHNEAFGKKDKPQTCSSCLRNRTGELRVWLKAYKDTQKGQAPEYELAYDLQDGTGLYVEKGKDEAPLCSKDGVIVSDGEYTVKDDAGEYSVVLIVKDGFAEIKDTVTPQYDKPEEAGYVAPAEGVTRIAVEGGLPIDFTPYKNSQDKGTVTHADGSTVKPGTYPMSEGKELAVQPGGKASIKEEDLT